MSVYALSKPTIILNFYTLKDEIKYTIKIAPLFLQQFLDYNVIENDYPLYENYIFRYSVERLK